MAHMEDEEDWLMSISAVALIYDAIIYSAAGFLMNFTLDKIPIPFVYTGNVK